MRGVLKLFGWLLLLLIAGGGIFMASNQVPDRSVDELKARWALPPSQFVKIAGMQVHLQDEGPPGDPTPLVLLHGTSASLHTWDGWVHALKQNHRVIRYDMPAFGLTGPHPDSNYTIENYAAMVLAVLDNRHVRRCVLVGNSLGGHVAWVTAVLHPDRVQRLVLVDASGYPYQSQSVPLGFRIARTPVLNRLMGDLLPPELVDRYFDLTTRAGNRQALVERFRQTQPGPLVRRIPELTLPTLILWGGRYRVIPPYIGDLFHKNILGSQLIRFNTLGHVPQEEDPVRTVMALKRFLAQPGPAERQ